MSERAEISAVIETTLKTASGVPTMFVETDRNVVSDTPPAAPWGRVTFVDGAENMVSVGGDTNLARSPILVYIDIFTALGIGDGTATDLAKATRNALRRLNVTGARWSHFLEGVEGKETAFYRKQVIAVFTKSQRV